MVLAEAETLLQQAGIRPTPNRTLVLQALAQATRTLSLADLETQLDTLDRSSIFRALRTLAEHRLIHSLTDPAGTLRYELCHQPPSHATRWGGGHDDEHVHFFCEHCRQTFCLSQIPVPHIPLPHGYATTATTLLLRGLCPNCAHHP